MNLILTSYLSRIERKVLQHVRHTLNTHAIDEVPGRDMGYRSTGELYL